MTRAMRRPLVGTSYGLGFLNKEYIGSVMKSANIKKYESQLKELKIWAKKFTNWDKLRSIQNSKIISSTYVWLFVVPLAAKFLSKINDSIKVNIDGVDYELILSLPFSWESFFYSSLCFVLGNIIYLLIAPELIKDFKDYGEYIGSRRNKNHLSRYKTERYKRSREIRDTGNNTKLVADVLRASGGNTVSKKENSDEEQFWDLYDYLNTEYIYFRCFCATFYLIGFMLFALIIIRNIFWVLTF